MEFLAAIGNLPISSGSSSTRCARVRAALAPVNATIQDAVQAQPHLNVDATSWPTATRQGWRWVAVSARAVCFRSCTGRGQDELRALLGTASRGIVGSDRLSAAKLVPHGQRQLCWAHLVRNLLSLLERYADERGWAQQMLDRTDDLFFAWHAYTEGWFDPIAVQQALIPIRLALHDLLTVGASSPSPKIAGFSRELLAQWDARWTVSRVDGGAPTKNAAARALRPAVLWRTGCFGARRAAGGRFVARMLRVRATGAQQGRPLLACLTAAVRAAWAGEEAPTLVPAPEPAGVAVRRPLPAGCDPTPTQLRSNGGFSALNRTP